MAKVIGAKAVVRTLKANHRKGGKALARGVKKAAQFLLREARKIVPVDEKYLYYSGHVETTGVGSRSESSVVFDMPYALLQHENLEFRHAPGKSAKYLEKPLRENKAKIKQIIREEVAKG